MSCFINRNEKKEPVSAYVMADTGKVKKDAANKPIESKLFNRLISEAKGADMNLGLPASVATSVWFATNTPSFKNQYKGELDENGEPEFLIGSDQKGTYAYFPSKEGSHLLRIDGVTTYKRLAYEENTAILSEVIQMEDFKGEAIIPEMRDYLMSFGEDNLIKATNSIDAVLQLVTDADNWEKAKALPDYEKENFRLNRFGQRERIDEKGNLLTGTSFNGVNQVQHLTNGFDASLWDESKTMGENLGILFWSRNNTPLTDKLLFDEKLMTYAEFVKDKDTRFNAGTTKGTIIHLRNQRQYARNQLEYDFLTEKIAQVIRDANKNKASKDERDLTEEAYSFVEEMTPAQDRRLGINSDSIVFFEKIIHAPILGIHGVIDKIAVRPDGKISMTEIKSTGFLEQNSKTFTTFRSDIQGELGVQLEVNALNKAKIQLVQNMIATALTYPGVRFSMCGIENLSNIHNAKTNGFIPLSKRDVSDILKVLLAFYKAEKEKGKASPFSHIYDQIMALDKISIRDVYLNPENIDAYVDVVELKYEKKGDKAVLTTYSKSDDRLAELESRLAKGVGMHADMNRISNYIKYEGKDKGLDQKFNFDEDIKEILAIFSNQGDDPAVFDEDISWANQWIGGTTSNVAHPVVQIYNEYFHAKKLQRDKEALKQRTAYQAYFTSAFNVWARANGVKEFSGENKFMERFFTSGNATKFWAHFYKEIDLGSYKKTVRLTQDEVTTKEDKALLKFLDDYYESVLSDSYSRTETKMVNGVEVKVNKKAFIYEDATFTIDNFGRVQTINHLQVFQGKGFEAGNTNSWNWLDATSVKDDNGNLIQRIPFTPTTSMLPYEYEQRYEWEQDENGTPIKNQPALIRLKNRFLKHISGFFDSHDNYKGTAPHRMVELKYLGSPSENISNHSMDLGAQFGKFMENIESKRHMDTVLAIAEAIASYSEKRLGEKGFPENQIRIADWLRKQARWQIKGESPDDDPVRNNRTLAKELFRIPMASYNEKTGKYKEYIVTLHTLLKGMTTFASYVHMSINPKGSLLNAAQAVFTSLKTGASFKAASTFIGLKKDHIDLKMSDYLVGLKVWAQSQESAINGNPDAAKLFLLAKEFSYLPSDYSYFDTQDSFGLNPNSWKNPSGLMVMHTAVEEANSMAILYAQMKSLKIGKPDENGEKLSAWDMYAVKENSTAGQKTYELEWKDNYDRGKSYQNGAMRSTYGVTAQEVIKLKRFYERIQGNYRHEERSVLEMYVLGQVVMQFKRYLPSMIRGQLRGRVSDPSLGRYVEVQKDGENVLEWRNRMITGKYILLMNWFFGAALRPLMSKIPATNGQLKHMTDMGSVKSKYIFAQQLSFSEMSEDEQTQIMDAMLTLSIFCAVALAGLKMEDENGKKDPFYLFLQSINETMVQPWNIFKMVETVKSGLSPVSFNAAANIIMGFGELIHRGFQVSLGYKDTMENEKGNIPGFKKIGTSLPIAKGFYNTLDLVTRKGAKGSEE